jgi:para-nitrobenzyl esterase
MKTSHSRRALLPGLGAALVALTIAASGGAGTRQGNSSIVHIDGGAVSGIAAPGGYAFRGLPYAAAPTGDLRWRPPRHPASWKGVRDATQFAPNCPQVATPFSPPGPMSEDCLYLNVYTPTLHRDADRPVLVWIHGGGFAQDGARDYDGSKLAAAGTVVVTINYRLGALGFLAHPALASRPGGTAGNYGMMDQQEALRWVRHNIDQFGGDRHNVTIAGESAGGVAVLFHMVSHGSRGLFDRAIVESGAFALNQQSLGDAEVAGQAFAAKAGCADQTAACLRDLPVTDLVKNFPSAAIPGVVDGKVITERLDTSLPAGRFARVPIINGINHDEERLFAPLGQAVSGGTFVLLPKPPVTPANYQSGIAAVLGVTSGRAAAIAAEYPLNASMTPDASLSTLVSDANFACPALQVDRWTSRRVPTFAYQFNDDSASSGGVATHGTELHYLFDLANAAPSTLNPEQAALASSMRAAWATFAASGDPSSAAVAWPSFNTSGGVLSLVAPQPQVWTDFDSVHHCSFWAAG